MALRVSGKNIDIGDALREQIETRLQAALGKYFHHGSKGHVTVSRDGTGFRAECLLHLDSGTDLRASGAAYDAYSAFSEAAEHIEKRLRRYKRFLKSHPAAGNKNGTGTLSDGQYSILSGPDEDLEEVPGDFQPLVVAERNLSLKQFSVSDAVVELDLTGAPFIVFRHGANGRVNLVYRRPDGHIGWIDPAHPESGSSSDHSSN